MKFHELAKSLSLVLITADLVSDELLVPFLLLDLSLAFRFYGGGEGGGGPDFLGEAGLNAVPRLGRRSLGSNPFGGSSRFRFRYVRNKQLFTCVAASLRSTIQRK